MHIFPLDLFTCSLTSRGKQEPSFRGAGCCVTRPAPPRLSLLFSRGIRCLRFPAAAAAEEKRATRRARRASRGNEPQTADGGTSSRSNYHLFVSAAVVSIDFSLRRIPERDEKEVHINNAIQASTVSLSNTRCCEVPHKNYLWKTTGWMYKSIHVRTLRDTQKRSNTRVIGKYPIIPARYPASTGRLLSQLSRQVEERCRRRTRSGGGKEGGCQCGGGGTGGTRVEGSN